MQNFHKKVKFRQEKPVILTIHRDGKKEEHELFNYGTRINQLCGRPFEKPEYPGNVEELRIFGKLSEGIIFEECKYADYAVLQKKENYDFGSLAAAFGKKDS